MTAVRWSPNLSVGSEEIDSEHAKLIDLLNALASEIEAGGGHDAIRERLDSLIAETEQHFRHEEAIMDRESYPELGYHQRIHQALIQEIAEFRDSLDDGMEIGSEITDFIKNWLISHIMESDKQLGGYLEGRKSAR